MDNKYRIDTYTNSSNTIQMTITNEKGEVATGMGKSYYKLKKMLIRCIEEGISINNINSGSDCVVDGVLREVT